MEEKQNTQTSSIPAGVPARTVSYVDGPGYHSFYTNNVAFAVNQMDFVLLLGEIIDMKLPEQEAVVERRARVTMTPAQGKVLAKILSGMVVSYEAQYGAIMDVPVRLPGDVPFEG